MAADGTLVRHFYEQTAFVARRYSELQGLRSVLLGCAAMLATGIGFGTWGPQSDAMDSITFVAIFCVAPIPGHLWLDRYYASEFGRSDPPVPSRRWQTYIVPISIGVLMISERYFGLRQLTLCFAALAAYDFWIVVRDWPWRSHYLVRAAAAAVACAVLMTSSDADSRSALASFFILGVAMVVAGARDHQLLATFLRKAPGNAPAGGTYGDAI